MDDAKRAGLAKNMYDKYPAVMLYNRAMSMLARQLFPDIIKGAGYTMDELQEIAGGRKFGDNKEKVIEIQETKPVEFLSDEQCTELSKVFAECDTAYIQKVWDTLDKMGIATYKEIPSSMYERIFMAAVKNRDEYRSSKEKPTSMDELIEAI